MKHKKKKKKRKKKERKEKETRRRGIFSLNEFTKKVNLKNSNFTLFPKAL